MVLFSLGTTRGLAPLTPRSLRDHLNFLNEQVITEPGYLPDNIRPNSTMLI